MIFSLSIDLPHLGFLEVEMLGTPGKQSLKPPLEDQAEVLLGKFHYPCCLSLLTQEGDYYSIIRLINFIVRPSCSLATRQEILRSPKVSSVAFTAPINEAAPTVIVLVTERDATFFIALAVSIVKCNLAWTHQVRSRTLMDLSYNDQRR